MGAICCKPEVIDFDGPVDLYHFYLLRAVGKGAFGKVRVVQHKQTKDLYALKYINKAKCIKMRAVSNIIQERRLLEEIDSPFVCNLRYAFQDDENMFMVLDLMLGGDLRFHLDRTGNMSEEVVRFYVAELALGLDYLHRLQIVHRDLKPDNVLLDEKGHAHLTDFNIAVHFSPRRPLTSIAGSMAYMAPEVLTKRGYLSSVDWWSLGVVAYELLFGRRPFRGKTNSALTHSILNDRCAFPENVENIVSRETVSCIKSLLERDPRKRLGCKSGIDEFKAHPWFAGVDWPAMEANRATPPFEPDSKRANFDATHELEELLLEDNPLKAKKRNGNADFDSLPPEMRQMEEHFLPFDHVKQRRKSYFRGPRGNGTAPATVGPNVGAAEGDRVSQISSMTHTLQDQPLSETAQPGAEAGRLTPIPCELRSSSPAGSDLGVERYSEKDQLAVPVQGGGSIRHNRTQLSPLSQQFSPLQQQHQNGNATEEYQMSASSASAGFSHHHHQQRQLPGLGPEYDEKSGMSQQQ
ncbi:related to serine/threonine protein kinase [Melanopsichium pennsylvanicum]|uniref:Related to serine/threonine protein kinase n=2 Tax=Melanopsichium pennsylvanicum TaxID=63383 RepID=A0AAJ4XNB5_9BASI|nr:related to serine/threonine protein kinase [Melanopsichium pennsylvanicum 4]SNX85760.1 related to serine/threonine protein kinase [Melanopsichium pennsylvanicum]